MDNPVSNKLKDKFQVFFLCSSRTFFLKSSVNIADINTEYSDLTFNLLDTELLDGTYFEVTFNPGNNFIST